MAVPIFRALWIAAAVSNIGTWMQDVGQGWLMTSLTLSPVLVSLVSASTNIPGLLLTLPAGVLADLADRRRLLLFTQSMMAVCAAVMAVFASLHLMTPYRLLLGTLTMGIAGALNAPAWSSAIPDVVPRPLLSRAVVWNGVSWNAARAIGPAIGGLVVAAAGPAAAFYLNAVSFLATIFVLFRWPRTVRPALGPPERFGTAIIAGVRFARHNSDLRAVINRTGLFAFTAAGGLALLPLLARKQMAVGASSYGVLLTCMGVGAVFAGILRGRLHRLLGGEVVLPGGCALISLGLFLLGRALRLAYGGPALFLIGVGWLLVLSSANTAAQLALPMWVRARGLGIYLLVFSGAMAAGSFLAGKLAEHYGLQFALSCSAAGVLAVAVMSVFFPLMDETAAPDLTAHAWSEAPQVQGQERGPVIVFLRYPLRKDTDLEAARKAVRALAQIRLRDGATGWRLYEDADDPTVLVEVFMVNSWDEHLRQHRRGTVADRQALSHAEEACGGGTPEVVHLVAAP
jgi:MFS family permease